LPQELTLSQQQKLFEVTYGRAEDALRDRFVLYDTYPDAAVEALADMAFDAGMEGLGKTHGEFLKAVEDEDWTKAARLSKRKGIGFERNEATREQFEQAAKEVAAYADKVHGR